MPAGEINSGMESNIGLAKQILSAAEVDGEDSDGSQRIGEFERSSASWLGIRDSICRSWLVNEKFKISFS